MSLALAQRLIGSHVAFHPEGTAYTVPGAGTSSRSSKPGATESTYIDLGIVEDDFEVVNGMEEIETFAPNPGGLVRYDVKVDKRKLDFNFTTTEFGFAALEHLFQTLALTSASTQANPLEYRGTKRGWLKFQQYDSETALAGSATILGEVWVAVKIGTVQFGSGLLKPKFECKMLMSTLNGLSF